MGVRRHGKEGHLPPLPSGNVVKCFCSLVVPTKRSVDELFCIIFTTCRRLLGALSPDPYRVSIPGLCWGTCPQTPNLPTPRKITAGAHAAKNSAARNNHTLTPLTVSYNKINLREI